MATQSRIENIVKIHKMSVAGGDLSLPKGHKYFVNLALDYDSVSREMLMELASEGSSIRVKAQAKLRKMEGKLKELGVVAESASELDEDALGWIEFRVETDFEREAAGPRDPQKTATSAYGKMTEEQKAAFIAETLGCSVEEAMGHIKR